MSVPLLGEIPIVQAVCESGDSGTPVATDKQSVVGKAFDKLADNVVAATEKKRNRELPPTKPVGVR